MTSLSPTMVNMLAALQRTALHDQHLSPADRTTLQALARRGVAHLGTDRLWTLSGALPEPPPVEARCLECGTTFRPTRAHQHFCSTQHRRDFHNLSIKRGCVILPYLLVSERRPGRYKDVDPELVRYAKREASALLDRWNREDRAAGRSTAGFVDAKRQAGWRASDLGE